MNNLPSGTVTFLFTDIEGSTKLAQGHPDKWEMLRARHHAILQSAIESHNGYVFQIIGDAFCAAFHTASDAVRAAVKSQVDLHNEDWGETPIQVRMGINTGTALVSEDTDHSGGYKGYTSMARVQRLMSAAHGGQTLISLATEELVRDDLPETISLRDMGERRLKDLIRPEHIYQLIIPNLPIEFPPLKTLDAYRHNLPIQMTSFIGREKEITEIIQLIHEHRLVTLTGIGGTGKTRLSLQTSADLIDNFPDGVWFIQLAPISDPVLIPQAVASVWNVHEQPSRSLSELLIEYVRAKHILLLLDNCEHVAGACAQFADELLHNAPNLKIIATSRVTLNVAGEMTYPVHPLALPNPQQVLSMPALTQYEAVRLFIERAITVRPTFIVTNANAPAVAQICQHLDGIPLAIELAAARIRALSPDEIAARLGNCFNLLTGGSRTMLPRQQTLRATMDWSYDLLPELERMLLNQLSVFAGNFSLEAVESVYLGNNQTKTNTLDLLTALVDNSLVIVEEGNLETRYRLLETVRQYAFEKLQAPNELHVTQDRHLTYFLNLAEQGASHVRIGQPAWIDRFETEYDNLYTALEYAITRDPELAIRLGTALDWFWEYSDRLSDGSTWANRILASTEGWLPGRMRAMALLLASTWGGEPQNAKASLEMARTVNDGRLELEALQTLTVLNWKSQNWAQVYSYAEEHLKIAQRMDEKVDITMALWALGAVAINNGDKESGRTLFEQALELSRKENLTNSIASFLRDLARLAFGDGDYSKAKALYMECAQVMRQMRFRSWLAGVLIRLGQIALQENDPLQARVWFGESLAIWQELKMDSAQVDSILGFAGVAGVDDKNELAARLFGTAETALKRLDLKMDDLDHMAYDPITATVRQKLGDDIFNAEWEAGKQMSLEEAIAFVLKELGQ